MYVRLLSVSQQEDVNRSASVTLWLVSIVLMNAVFSLTIRATLARLNCADTIQKATIQENKWQLNL